MKNCVLGIRRFLQVSGPIRASRSRSWTTSRAAAPPSPRSRSAPAAAAAPARACARRSPAPASRSGLGSASPNTSPARMLSAQQKTFLQGSCSDAKPARASRSASRLGLAYVAVEDGEPWVACLPLAHPVLAAHASVSVYRRQKASRKGGQRKVRWGEGGQSHPQRLGEDNARARLRAEVGNGRWPIVDVNLRHTVPPQRLAAQALIAVVRREKVSFVTAWDADLRSSRNPEAVTRLHRVLWEQRGLGRLEQQGARAASDGVCRARIRSLRARPRGWCRS